MNRDVANEHRGACREPLNLSVSEHPGWDKDLDLTCASILFVGEDNPQSTAPEHALYNYPPRCAGNRLQERILGLHEDLYLACWRTNRCVGGWSMKVARERALRVLFQEDAPWSVIVMLGRKVAEAFAVVVGGTPLSPFKFFASAPAISARLSMNRDFVPNDEDDASYPTLISLPHPSGRNLIWNDPQVALNARAMLRQIAPEMPWGGLL
jgi:hypothetical protein